MELAKAYATYATPSNIRLAVAALLCSAGLIHALPGPSLKLQEDVMKVPGRFLQCAGVLMMASGALYYSNPSTGIFAVSLCMGGAFATASNMPRQGGGTLFSSLIFTVVLWSSSETPELALSIVDAILCGVAFAVGIAGGVLVPHHKLMKSSTPAAKKDESVNTSEKDKETKTAEPPSTSTKEPEKADASLRGREAAAKSSSRSRVASPGPVAKK
eukprot:TRINITY_DN80883_c0_g1_i1.p1 TRINITY_DN80883_c0_g1~~TRINITY_DN80883_c0_g1_i1.p1  ORF type:complete len:225 (+),score=42.37 TRINITY_DN80883_c0_g1_i1:32-676(+)